MAHNLTIETMGAISKEESLVALKDNVLPNTWVLEALEPFPGYYHLNSQMARPKFIYLMTKSHHGIEEVARISQYIRSSSREYFDSAPATITIYKDTFPCIRVRDLGNYRFIKDLQEAYEKKGIRFIKKLKTLKDPALIKTHKFFELKELKNGIYLDRAEPEMGYIQIPAEIDWKTFETITFKIKNNWDQGSFDAALGTIYRRTEIQDVVRIYRKELEEDYLLGLRESYLKELDKIGKGLKNNEQSVASV